jgi:pimeloyl-ACP methyl ester carboxylesterase
MADDLEDLLGTFGHGPFVLVATSGGALVVREYALRRPAGIAGLVLVDPTDERVDAVFTPRSAASNASRTM